jgi:DNA-binding SARP family transcriptional activator
MRRTTDVIRAAAASLASLLLLIGLPALLVAGVGWPLPRRAPDLGAIADTLTGSQPLESTTVWKILAVILWLAWLQVLVAFVVEGISVARGSLPTTLPGLNLAHGLVAPLVAAIVLVLPVGNVTRAGAATLPPASAAPPSPAVAVAAPSAPVPPTVTDQPNTGTTQHTVARRETLWDLAERYLGDGYRAPEIFELNRGRTQPDGNTLTDPSLIRPGWVLDIPTSERLVDTPATSVTVQPGDTLWDIADEHLDDGYRFTDIVELNQGRPQPDGLTLRDPSVIEPGWVLELPDGEPLAPSNAVDQAAQPRPETPTTTADGTPTTTTAPPAPTTSAATPDETSVGGAAQAEVDEITDQADDPRPAPPLGLVAGGVATAGLVALLDRRRRAQLRRRRRGQVPPPLTAEQAAADIALRSGAERHHAAAIDVATRTAAARSGATGLAPVDRIEVDDEAITFALSTPATAPPGFDDDGPARWTADVAAAEPSGDCAAPVPTLTALGRTDDGREVLIDLEHPPVTTICGAPNDAVRLTNAIGLAVASSPWSEHTRVLVVGRDVPPLDDMQRVESLADALAELEARARLVADGLDAARCATLAQARAAGITPDLWAPVVAISTTTPTSDELNRIVRLQESDRGGIALVICTESDAAVGRVLRIDGDGRLAVDSGEPFSAHLISDDEARGITDLLEQADAECIVDLTSDSPTSTIEADGGGALLEALTRELDVIIRVLGDVDTVRTTDDERLTVPKQKSLEAVTYISLREARVDRDNLQAALWPAGANSAKTFHNTIWAARKMLGQDRDGADLIPEPVEGHYELSDRVGTDYGLFHELTARAEETDDAERAADLLAAALTLVRGEPFTGVGRGYAWAAPHSGLIVAQVVDAAEELAEMRLATGDWRGAEWAARQGLRVFPCEERLYRVLMRAAHAAGSVPGVHRAFQELAAAVADPDDGVEPDDSVHPETIALLDELTTQRASA